VKDQEALSDSKVISEKERNRSFFTNLPRKDKASLRIGKADTTKHHRIAKENRERKKHNLFQQK